METQNLVKELKRCGIRTAEYVKPPIGKDVFALAIRPTHEEGVVTVNQGKAKVEVHGNKNLRQAAVTVRENARAVRRLLFATVACDGEPSVGYQRQRLRGMFPIVMPRK